MIDPDRPFTRYVLEDALDHDVEAIRLVLDMLKATTQYQGHAAGFHVDIVWNGTIRAGYEYFLGSSGGQTDPSFANHRVLPREIVPPLHAIGFIAPSTYPNVQGFWQFTDKARAWYETYGGPSDEVVQRAIGRAIHDAGPDGLPLSALDAIAGELGISRARVDEQVELIRRLNVIAQRDEPPVLSLDTVAGPIWILRRFGPISDMPMDLLRPPAEVPLAAVPSLVQSRNDLPVPVDEEGPPDVFLSYASEDEAAVARPLYEALTAAGLKVWFAPITMQIGDDQRREIDHGIATSRFSIVILSKHYLSKGWTNYELNGLIIKNVGGNQRLLPIWHEISKQEIIDFSPTLANKVARKTSDRTPQEIADEIIRVIRAAP
jgi:hypothetical protein